MAEQFSTSSTSSAQHSAGWTGGQFSVMRLLIGTATASYALTLAPQGFAFTSLFTLTAALLVLVGLRVGQAANVAAIVVLLGPSIGVAGSVLSRFGLFAALLVLARSAPAPFGSLAARGRKDPGGAWEHSSALLVGTRLALAVLWFLKASSDFGQGASALAAAEVALPLVFLFPSLRCLAWVTLLGVLLGQGLIAEMNWGLLLLHLLAFEPHWIPPRSDSNGPDVVFYDGDCALCHGVIRFALAECSRPGLLAFAPLGGARYREITGDNEWGNSASRPDAVALARAEGGELLWRSQAVFRIFQRLGGFWAIKAAIGSRLPQGLSDWAYDRIAKSRKTLFGTTESSCPMMPEVLRSRMDLRP